MVPYLLAMGMLERMVNSSMYLFIAGICAAFLVINMLMGGHDHDMDHDVDHEIDHDVSHDVSHEHEGDGQAGTGNMSVFSVKVLMAAGAGFGIGGFFAANAGLGPFACVASGILGSGAVGGGAYLFLNTLYRSQSSETVRTDRLVGTTGTVDTSIDADGIGKIVCTLPSGRQTFLAKSANGEPLSLGTPVRVDAVHGSIVLVSRL